MTHFHHEQKNKGEKCVISRPDPIRGFSIGLAVILMVLAGVQAWLGHNMASVILGSAGVLSLVLGLLLPAAMRPVYLILMKVGMVLGWINTRIFLALIFYGIFTPASLIMKMFGRDQLSLKRDDSPSYWIKKPEEKRGPERYEKMY